MKEETMELTPEQMEKVNGGGAPEMVEKIYGKSVSEMMTLQGGDGSDDDPWWKDDPWKQD